MMLAANSEYLKPSEKAWALTIFSILWVAVIGLYFFIWYSRKRLDHPEFKSKYGNLLKGIHLTRKDSNIFYFPNFLVRRLIFFSIPIIMINYPA
jgi:hypothetical protein